MKKVLFIISWALIIAILTSKAFSQGVVISANPGASPDNSAMLDIQSTAKGFLVPRMTQAQRNAIINPASGLMIYQTNITPGFYYNAGIPGAPVWQMVGSNAGVFSQWTTNGSAIHYNTGNVGIGANPPVALLHVSGSGTGEGNVLFQGSQKASPGAAPAQGAGTRMMWYPDKAAFRAGRVTNANWDSDSIGYYSVAMGIDTKAKGPGSTALGYITTASGHYSTAFGYQAVSTGQSSVAGGQNTQATGHYATAFGYYTTASNYYSTALGFESTASGWYSTAIGGSNTASGTTSTAMGAVNIASGMTSTAMGSSNNASGNTSTAMGASNNASGTTSTAMGASNVASGNTSTAMGSNTSASGNIATSMGRYTSAPSLAETVIGSYNAIYTPSGGGAGWNVNDRLFVVGNGTSEGQRSNALVILKNGNTGIGTSTPAASLHVNGTGTGEGNVLFTGTFKASNPGSPPASGSGTRMMWYPDKAAFRAGGVSGSQWNIGSIGIFSSAWGLSTIASGSGATAWGENTIASGSGATAWGYSTTASGVFATAAGLTTTASGQSATAWGNNTTASGYEATAWGNSTIASALNATAWGENTTALGSRATAWGDGTSASGSNATVWGFTTVAPSYVETVMGRYNTLYTPNGTTAWNSNDRLFVIGNGTSEGSRANAFTVLKNGKIGTGGMDAPAAALHVLHPNISNEGIRIQNTGANNRHWTIHTNNGGGTLILYSSIGGSTPVGNFNGSTGAYSATSNRHLKTDITILDTDVLARVNQLEPSRYRYFRDPNNQFTIGFIAEDIQPLFPELVETVGEEGENMAVNYAGFSVVAISAIQEQQKIIDTMMGIIENQQGRIEELHELSKAKNGVIATLKAEKDAEMESLITRLTTLEALLDLPAGNTHVSLD